MADTTMWNILPNSHACARPKCEFRTLQLGLRLSASRGAAPGAPLICVAARLFGWGDYIRSPATVPLKLQLHVTKVRT